MDAFFRLVVVGGRKLGRELGVGQSLAKVDTDQGKDLIGRQLNKTSR